MSAPTDSPTNQPPDTPAQTPHAAPHAPHQPNLLPTPTSPRGLNRSHITDMCNYAALNAVAAELNKVRSGYYTFTELEDAIAAFSARADEISAGRWPSVDHDALPPSTMLAAAPAPAATPDPGADENPEPSGQAAPLAAHSVQGTLTNTPEPPPAPASTEPETTPQQEPEPNPWTAPEHTDDTQHDDTQLMPAVS